MLAFFSLEDCELYIWTTAAWFVVVAADLILINGADLQHEVCDIQSLLTGILADSSILLLLLKSQEFTNAHMQVVSKMSVTQVQMIIEPFNL